MTIISDTTVKERTVRVRVPWHEISALIGDFAINEAQMDHGRVETRVELRQLEEGSPPYSVQRWEAVVVITTPLE